MEKNRRTGNLRIGDRVMVVNSYHEPKHGIPRYGTISGVNALPLYDTTPTYYAVRFRLINNIRPFYYSVVTLYMCRKDLLFCPRLNKQCYIRS